MEPQIAKADEATFPIELMNYQDAARRLAELMLAAEELNRHFDEEIAVLLSAKIRAGMAA